MTLFHQRLLAVTVTLLVPASVAAQATSRAPLAVPADPRLCLSCAFTPPETTLTTRDLASSSLPARAGSAYAVARRSSGDRAVIGAVIGAAAGAAFGAVVGSGSREREEGLGVSGGMVVFGLVGAVVGAIGGVLSR